MSPKVLTARQFIERSRAPDAKLVTLKVINDDCSTAKFILKTTKSTYTLTVKRLQIINSIIDELPENLKKELKQKPKQNDQNCKKE